jgi:hypothetical protein
MVSTASGKSSRQASMKAEKRVYERENGGREKKR